MEVILLHRERVRRKMVGYKISTIDDVHIHSSLLSFSVCVHLWVTYTMGLKPLRDTPVCKISETSQDVMSVYN